MKSPVKVQSIKNNGNQGPNPTIIVSGTSLKCEDSTTLKTDETDGHGMKSQSPDKYESKSAITPLPKIPEHKSFEMEDLPDTSEDQMGCHRSRTFARVVIASAIGQPLSPQPLKASAGSKFDYPIVRHHPLFAKNQRTR